MNNNSDKIIEIKNVTKEYVTSSGNFRALNNVSLEIGKGQLIAITGKSGSGKSTLLNIISGIDKPTNGDIIVSGIFIGKLSESKLAEWRGKNIGVVFQFFQLIPTLTIAENVMLPMDFCDTYPKKERRAIALALLEKVGISEQADKFPSALSGGQQQRASIARALANDPQIIIADEPTGNLDSHNAETILNLFTKLSREGKTVIIVTHEKEFSKFFANNIIISDGEILKSNGVTNQMSHSLTSTEVM